MVLEAVLDIFNLSQDLQSTETTEDLDSLDPEESTFQASFSKLGASESRARDPVEGVPDAKLFLSKQLAAASARNPGKVGCHSCRASSVVARNADDGLPW